MGFSMQIRFVRMARNHRLAGFNMPRRDHDPSGRLDLSGRLFHRVSAGVPNRCRFLQRLMNETRTPFVST